ncbi:kinase-like protein [Gymnopus androsaceus JB14]|uniref:Kinase-like protein n=1 Tax=Gymnopus androsaceus JB14 TaxID=1447944 RepID=A0A6A4HCP3_9AGAR|nr:kinase-like protein [Gymnopus androsaceus JB14]
MNFLGTWLKPVSANEEQIYKILTPHPRIIVFQGIAELDDYNDCLILEHHSNGNLWTYLLNNEIPPLAKQINWALEITEGLSYIHSKAVVWADNHFSNILVTKDLHVVLADFAFSLVSPSLFHKYTTLPPPVFTCLKGYYGIASSHVDIFAFGVMLFALLTRRFPWSANLNPSLDEQFQVMHTHRQYKWNVIEDETLKGYFGMIVEKCFKIVLTDGVQVPMPS